MAGPLKKVCFLYFAAFLSLLHRKTDETGELIKEDLNVVSSEEQKCTECNFATTAQTTLKHHMAAHHGIGAYQCNQCEFVAGFPGVLKKHKESHGIFPCDKCSYIATLNLDLKKHLKAGLYKVPLPIGGEGGSLSSLLGIEYQAVKREREYQGCGEAYNVEKR